MHISSYYWAVHTRVTSRYTRDREYPLWRPRCSLMTSTASLTSTTRSLPDENHGAEWAYAGSTQSANPSHHSFLRKFSWSVIPRDAQVILRTHYFSPPSSQSLYYSLILFYEYPILFSATLSRYPLAYQLGFCCEANYWREALQLFFLKSCSMIASRLCRTVHTSMTETRAWIWDAYSWGDSVASSTRYDSVCLCSDCLKSH